MYFSSPFYSSSSGFAWSLSTTTNVHFFLSPHILLATSYTLFSIQCEHRVLKKTFLNALVCYQVNHFSASTELGKTLYFFHSIVLILLNSFPLIVLFPLSPINVLQNIIPSQTRTMPVIIIWQQSLSPGNGSLYFGSIYKNWQYFKLLHFLQPFSRIVRPTRTRQYQDWPKNKQDPFVFEFQPLLGKK